MFRSTTTIACALLLACATAFAAEHDEPELRAGWYVRIETSLGAFVVHLFPERTPQAVAHFAGLADGTLEWADPATGEAKKRRHYDEIPVQRIETGRLFEVGDASAAGRATPRLWVPLEGADGSCFDRAGMVGMARQTGRISGVVFFVTAAPVPWFERKFPCIGEVVLGLDIVRKITEAPSTKDGRPIEPVIVRSVDLFSVGEVAPLPTPVHHEPPPPPRPRLKVAR
jgi:peptidyl-prolyl cis-trans isomerase A (cyclophilin A)